MIGLKTFEIQNCKRLGLINGTTLSARESHGSKKQGKFNGEKSVMAFKKTMNKLPGLMERSFASIFLTKNKEEKLNKLKDHLQRQTALHGIWYVCLGFTLPLLYPELR